MYNGGLILGVFYHLCVHCSILSPIRGHLHIMSLQLSDSFEQDVTGTLLFTLLILLLNPHGDYYKYY